MLHSHAHSQAHIHAQPQARTLARAPASTLALTLHSHAHPQAHTHGHTTGTHARTGTGTLHSHSHSLEHSLGNHKKAGTGRTRESRKGLAMEVLHGRHASWAVADQKETALHTFYLYAHLGVHSTHALGTATHACTMMTLAEDTVPTIIEPPCVLRVTDRVRARPTIAHTAAPHSAQGRLASTR